MVRYQHWQLGNGTVDSETDFLRRISGFIKEAQMLIKE